LLICGLVLIVPFIGAIAWVASQHSVGVGIDLEAWRFWAIILSPIAGACAIAWSMIVLIGRRGRQAHRIQCRRIPDIAARRR
jgi:hypothetical protein